MCDVECRVLHHLPCEYSDEVQLYLMTLAVNIHYRDRHQLYSNHFVTRMSHPRYNLPKLLHNSWLLVYIMSSLSLHNYMYTILYMYNIIHVQLYILYTCT